MKHKRIGLRILAIILSVLMLMGCHNSGDSELSRETESAEETSAPMEEADVLSTEALKGYTIVLPKEASETMVRASTLFRNKLNLRLRIKLNLKSDRAFADDSASHSAEYEILLGDCDRNESRQFSENMKTADYGYTMIGNKLVICGGSEEATVQAIHAFIKAVIQKCDAKTEVFFRKENALMQRGAYEIETLMLQGSDISEYSVVYPDKNVSSKSLSAEFIRQIALKTGFLLTSRSDKEPVSGKEILIGTTNRSECSAMTSFIEAGTYQIGAEGNYVYARGADGIGDFFAVNALLEALLEPADLNQKIVLEKTVTKEVPMEEKSLKSMSFNILYTSLTEERKESVRQTILTYLPDTFGVQEAVPSWMNYLQTSLGGIYDWVGVGRDGGSNGEYCAIFYKRDRFDLIESGTKWMSETPDVVSKFKESSLNRVFTYAILLEKKSNTEIMVVNTHLEHSNSAARELQVEVLLDFLKDYSRYPIVLTGDFNAGEGSKVYRMVTAQLSDSSGIAETAERHGTFHNYGNSSSVIDYAFVSRENIAVSHYRVITEKMNGMLPSDHYALIIEYNLLP